MMFCSPKPLALLTACALAFSLSACTSDNNTRPQSYQPPPVAPQAPIAPSYSGPVLQSDGSCSAAAPVTATAITIGMGECELVRIKGRTPTDVLIGESGRGGRETQILYAEPTGRELYLFNNNKLMRIRTPERSEDAPE